MKQRIVIAGGSGLLGSDTRPFLAAQGYDVCILTRNKARSSDEIQWDPSNEFIDSNVLEGSFAVLNFCGLSLDKQRWTKRNKKRIRDSRIIPAQFLGKLIGRCQHPPLIYIGSSGIGIYGDCAGRIIHEGTKTDATGFIPQLVKDWEAAHATIDVQRRIILRTGVVISAKGGFLDALITPARFGLYPYFGNGRQIVSWMAIRDFLNMLLFVLQNDVGGTLHATAPQGSTQKEIMRALKSERRSLGLVFSVPAFVMRAIIGEMAGLLLESCDARPDMLVKNGFRFESTTIHAAIRAALHAT